MELRVIVSVRRSSDSHSGHLTVTAVLPPAPPERILVRGSVGGLGPVDYELHAFELDGEHNGFPRWRSWLPYVDSAYGSQTSYVHDYLYRGMDGCWCQCFGGEPGNIGVTTGVRLASTALPGGGALPFGLQWSRGIVVTPFTQRDTAAFERHLLAHPKLAVP